MNQSKKRTEQDNSLEIDLSGFQICHVTEQKGSILREKRLVLGLTQSQVAERANILEAQYQKFESNTRNIMHASFNMACRIIEALEMDISKFYHGDYHIGEEVFFDEEGMKYSKTGKLTSEDITDDV